MKYKHQRIRLQEFNRFDIERILIEVLESIGTENERIIEVMNMYKESLGNDTLAYFLEEIDNNSAQVMRISSLLFFVDDLGAFFTSGPLVRKEEEGE